MGFCDQINKELEGYGPIETVDGLHHSLTLSVDVNVFSVFFQPTDIGPTPGSQGPVPSGVGGDPGTNGQWG